MCVLFVKEFGRDKWVEFGRTEIIWNNLNPEWAKKFLINYFFEERQQLKFEVFVLAFYRLFSCHRMRNITFSRYDIDTDSPDLKQHDFLGSLECTLGEIVSRGKLERPLVGGPKQNFGKIISTVALNFTIRVNLELMFFQ